MMDWAQIIQSIIYFISLFYVVFWLIVLLDTEDNKKQKLKETPEVSIAIPAYNEEDNIVGTLKAVSALNYPKDKIKLIFIDDGSKDKTYQRAQQYLESLKRKFDYKDVIMLKQKNQGKYAAMNNALKHADTEFFATLDSDSFPEKNSLINIMAIFEDKDIKGASSILKIYKPTNVLQKVQSFEYAVNHFYKKLISKVNAIHVMPGPLSVYRTSIIKKIGGFKDAHKTEDMEIVLRMQKKHYKVIQCEDSVVYTKAPYRLKELYNQRHRWNYGSFRNVMDYSDMMFRRKYGDFGFFQLPMILLSGFLGIILIGLIVMDIIKSAIPTFKMLQMFNFNLFEYYKNTHFNIIWLDLDLRIFATVMGFFILSMIIIWLSFKTYKERYTLKKTIPFIAYLFFYYIFLAIVWLGVFKDMMLGKGTRWKK
ncbi:MAG: glycosyltransferase family 2 protein [Nanoarchaeota archaeon]|nr:glycosyltransferase family 2 protein [Nanoarchaeota archaeon]